MGQLVGAAAAGTAGTTALTQGVATGLTLGKGVAALTPTASGIFSAAQPALAGLPSLTPALTQAPGIFSMAQPALAGLPSSAGIFSQAAPALGGLKSFAPLASQAAPAVSQVAPAVSQVAPAVSQVAPSLDIAGEAAKWRQYATNAGYTTPGGPAAQITREMVPGGITKGGSAFENFGNLISNPSMQNLKGFAEEHPYATSAAVGLGTQALMGALNKKEKAPEQDKGMIRPYEYTRTQRPEAYAVSPLEDTSEQRYFNTAMTPGEPYSATSPKAKEIEKIAEGGIAKAYAVGGPIETMAAMNAVGANTGYPMAGINTAMYSNPMVQRPEAVNVISPSGDAGVGAYSGEPKFARGGLSDLGDYSDGGRLLKGPGDGVSDSIPAVIGKRQPARLADGEFVIPARIVSELGNGSTEAGARKLYAMMDRIQKGRRKSVGKGKVAVDSKSDKHLPA